MKSFFLTFDTEDFISDNSIPGLHSLLELLKKHELTGLFFITGLMAEKLAHFPKTVDLLNEHQIGYHSSSHSVHPTIFEFTDVASYEEAYQASLFRETAHIDIFTGKTDGPGGINALKTVFPKKNIVAFRAPGYCWTPPHLEALRTLGITYDFSTNFSIDPVFFHGITFYPFTFITTHWQGRLGEHYRLQRMVLNRETSVLTIHPSSMVNRVDWDLIYYTKFGNLHNPEHITQPPAKSPSEIKSNYHRFNLLLKHLATLQKLHLLNITPQLKPANKTICPNLPTISEYYKTSMKWAEMFNYKPKFIMEHFVHFFQMQTELSAIPY